MLELDGLRQPLDRSCGTARRSELANVLGTRCTGRLRHAQYHRRMAVVGLENRFALRRPGLGKPSYEPVGMRRARRQIRIGGSEQGFALAHEAAQHRIDKARGPGEPEGSGCIHSQMDADFGCPARILDLMRRRDEQGAQQRIHLRSRPTHQRAERWCEAQIPTHRTECDGAHGSAIGA